MTRSDRQLCPGLLVAITALTAAITFAQLKFIGHHDGNIIIILLLLLPS
jgi:hypothetical protein